MLRRSRLLDIIKNSQVEDDVILMRVESTRVVWKYWMFFGWEETRTMDFRAISKFKIFLIDTLFVICCSTKNIQQRLI